MIKVVIPDRGDRPKMLANCLRQMKAQTMPHEVILIDDKPEDERPDITWRYKKGYEQAQGAELICFVESDDWYDKNYLYTLYSCWVSERKPDILGIDYTYYYHLGLRKYFKYGHIGRASMMNTAIKPGLNIRWPHDNYRFVDMELWRQIKGVTFAPDKPISIGMKGHGEGLTGGTGHNDRMWRYTEDDNGFLESTLDKESYEFFNKFNTSIKG